MAELLGAFLGFILTLFVFSYLLGDNLFFRFAIHIFIGVTAAFAVVMAWYNVIWPQLIVPLLFGSQPERLLAIVPFALSALLLAKAFPRVSVFGTPVMAYLVGIGAAAAIGGAVGGTIFPQVKASINLFDLQAILQNERGVWLSLVNGSIILVGTLTTLIYFHFGARSRRGLPSRRAALIQGLSWVGQFFIAVTFGALFAGVFAAALSALIERLYFLADFIISFIFPVT